MKIKDIIKGLKEIEKNEEDYKITLEIEPIIEEFNGWYKKTKYIKYIRTITIEDKSPIKMVGEDNE